MSGDIRTGSSFLMAAAVGLSACSPQTASDNQPADDDGPLTWDSVQDSADRVFSVEGLAGPEAVRYDPEQDVYFVSNFNGGSDERNAHGFISRVEADGTVSAQEFMTGTDEAPLHAPRGMNVSGDTLWVADVDGVHGFDRHSGTHLTFVDLSGFEPSFLNDIAVGPGGNLYVTDTGSPARVYGIVGGTPEIAAEDPALGPANGITWDAENEHFILAPWGSGDINAWLPEAGIIELPRHPRIDERSTCVSA